MSKPRIAIVDYGMGNIRSVANALDEVGGVEELVSDPDRLDGFDKVILPGVGAFAEAIAALDGSGMREALDAYRVSGRPLLGICLGMQLMCSDSQEDGFHRGLGWFAAHVVALPSGVGLVVPHMGWNEVAFTRDSRVTTGVPSGTDFYFVHSYCVQCEVDADVLGRTEYGVGFASMIAHENVTGMQFHPEKSQQVGLQLLRNFAEA